MKFEVLDKNAHHQKPLIIYTLPVIFESAYLFPHTTENIGCHIKSLCYLDRQKNGISFIICIYLLVSD
jgi:hypothetical protein